MQYPFRRLSLNQIGTAVLCLGFIVYASGTTPLIAQMKTAQRQPALSDADIQANVDNALLHSPQLQGQAITAATISGEVTLSGVVKDKKTRQAAQETVSKIQGVRAVQNNLTIGDPSAARTEQSAQPAQPQSGPGTQQQVATPPDQWPTGDQIQDTPVSNAPLSAAPPSTPTYAPPPPASAAVPNTPAAPQTPPPPPVGNATAPAPYSPNQGYRPAYNGYPETSQQQVSRPVVSGPVTVPTGTLLRVRTSEPLDAKHVQPGTMFEGTAAGDIYEGGVIAIPRGATIEGEVVAAKAAGAFGGKPELELKLTTLNLGGRTYPIASDIWSSQGSSKTGYTAGNTAGGAVVGALLGAFIGGGPGAAFGAVAGGVGGASVSGATSGPHMLLPAETVLNFHLSSPVTVQPVSYQEAERLAASQPQQRQPQLQRRPVYMAAPVPYYYPYYPIYYGRYW